MKADVKDGPADDEYEPQPKGRRKRSRNDTVQYLRGSVPKNGPIDCASKNHFSLNSADGKGLVPSTSTT